MIDDSTLLRRFAEERREADFAELVRRHLGLVYRAALRRTDGDAHLAEDIAQQVFTTLSREAVSVQRHPVLSGWLYLTTRHAAANAMRSETRRRLREQEAQVMNELTSPDNSEADWEKIRPELDRVMDELPERDRHAVLLRYFQNQPFGEIGATLRLSENAARMRVERALERLRELLAKRGVVSTSAALTALLANQAAAAVPNTLAATITSAALVGGAAAAGSIGLITFMTTTKMLSVTGALACIAAGIMLYDGKAVQQVRADLVADQQRCDALQRELRELREQTEVSNQRARTAAAKRDTLQKQLNDMSSAQKAVAASTMTLDEQLMYSDPEYQRRYLERTRLGFRKEYAALYRKLGLTPQQIEAFEAVELNAQQAAIDLRSVLFAQGLAPSDPSHKSLFKTQSVEIKEERDKKLREILGETGLATYKAYDARPRDITATTLALDLYYSGSPLTVDQGAKLDDIIAANSTLEDSRSKTNWENVFNKTNGLLDTPQLEALKKRVEKRKARERMQELMKAHLAGQP